MQKNTHCCWVTAGGAEGVALMQLMGQVLTGSWEVMTLAFGTVGQMS